MTKTIEYVVSCNLGHGKNPSFSNYVDAVARHKLETSIPSYVDPSRMRLASIHKVTTITEDVTP